MTLYEKLRAIGAEIDHHESDLYVRWTPEVARLVRESRQSAVVFRCERSGQRWVEVRFAYDPFWTVEAGRALP